MINMLLNASVTGGIVILLWYLTYPLSRKYFKASWHYFILKIAMAFMIFPIGIFAPMFNNILAGLFTKPELPYISEQMQVMNITLEKLNSVNSVLSDLVFPDVQYSLPLQTNNPSETNPHIPYLQLIWLIGAIVIFSNGICKMHRFRKQIFNSTNSNVDRKTMELFLQCKEQLKVCGRINLRTSEYIKTPLAFGLINPLVIFPETEMSADEKRLAITHELAHIKNGDLWLKFFAFVISSVHWFNPLAHLLRRKISIVSEEYCDECIVKTMMRDERLLYGNLILKVVSDIAAPQSKFCSTLSAPTKNIKRRLFNMMNLKKSRKSIIVFSVIVAFILCALATIYAFAANTNAPESYTPDSRIIVTEINGIIHESMLNEFIPDEQAVGKWEVVDFVENIDDFETGKQWWQDNNLCWLSVEFLEDGKGEVKFDTGVSNNDFKLTGIIRTDSIKWTNGLIDLYGTIPEYTIKHMNDEEYMFIQWKSGDYTIRKMTPAYYVFRKIPDSERNYAFATNTNVPESYTPDSRIIVTEINGIIRESMPNEFILDEQAVGKWEVVDLVKNIDDFEVGKQWSQGNLFWLSVEFSEDGTGEVRFDTGVSNNDFKLTGIIRTDSIKWTNGLIDLYSTIPEYTIKHMNDEEYMFIQWKSGDYTIRKMTPAYYVFKKIPDSEGNIIE